jgi:ketosteroid isomerase-like protein
MVEDSKRDKAAAAMRRINQAWLDGQVEKLRPLVHPEITLALPGFAGRIEGREEFLAGFRDFTENAKIHEFHARNHQVDVAGDTAVVTFQYEMVYQRSGKRWRSTGRDLWVFQKQDSEWIAGWRTLLDMDEQAA